MKTKIIEAHGNGLNWGKFLVAQFDKEWQRLSQVDTPNDHPLLGSIGWHPKHIWVMDLQTCEGAAFSPGGSAKADLDKHKVWVCPLFEPFLGWLYTQDLTDIDALPEVVELPDAPAEWFGYRREGTAR